VPYTTIAFYEARGFGSWRATTRDGVVAVQKREGAWRGSWPVEGPWIEIPGARDLTVRECAVGWTRARRQLGARYTLIDREWAGRLEPMRAWCSEHAESSIADPDAFWVPLATWAAGMSDHLPMPFLPEYDERGEDLKRVAYAARRYREAAAALEQASDMRARAIVQAGGRRSRRRVADVAGLSFARVQQLMARAKMD
jgi:hypothetical protein